MATKMDKKLKREWVKALRSGEYKQGKGTLYSVSDGSERFCCLGVLCDIGLDSVWHKDDYGDYWIGGEPGNGKSSDSLIPESLAHRLGIGDVTQADLAEKNDSGWSFKRIATYIEKCDL